MQETKSSSLHERLGGKASVSAAVDIVYERVLAEGLDMEHQKGKQRAFLTMAFGGPVNYTGRDMHEAHAPLVERGLAEKHFKAVASHLAITLAELDVPTALIL